MTSIRLAENKDVPSLVELLVQVCNHHNELYPDIFKKDGNKYTNDKIEQILLDFGYIVLVAEIDGVVRGMAISKIIDRPELSQAKATRTVFVEDLSVEENFRHIGLGTALIGKIEEIAKKQNAKQVELNCWYANTSAYEFYQCLGYQLLSVKFSKKM